MAKTSLEDLGQRLGRHEGLECMVNRGQAVAILLGPIVAAMLAFGALAAHDDTNVVIIENFAFTPPELTIAVGTTVKWVNHDDTPHLVVKTIAISQRSPMSQSAR
jgi:plastocyanin